ncbi:MAG: tetratricopeptide repeat protein [Candidatus Glassbacteria bacterium]|nr:tetratricopeptide repeat protein [Candidatus Glassbacteria bacterium]
MYDNLTDDLPAGRTCIVCGDTFSPGLVDDQGRCAACRQSAERFIGEFSASLGQWAAGLKDSQPDPGSLTASGRKTRFSLSRLFIALVLVVVGYYAYDFIDNYHLIQTQWYLNQGHVDKARLHLEKAIEADRKDPDLRFVLGNLCYQQGELDSAIESFRQTIELDSLHAGALNNLAWVFAQMNSNLDEALRLSKRSLEIDPENPYYLDTIAEIYFLKKEYYRALTYIRRAVEQDPPNVEYYRRRLEIIKNLVYRKSRFSEV